MVRWLQRVGRIRTQVRNFRTADEFRSEVSGCPPPIPFAESEEIEASSRPAEALFGQTCQSSLKRTTSWCEHLFDITGAAVALVVFSPLMLAAALAIKLTSPGPVLFRQRREGRFRKPFTIYKFRTMYAGADAMQAALRVHSEQDGPAFKMSDDPRVTPIGRILRSTSIDEIPQFFNVLRREMSLVGPRPLPIAESVACATWQRRRLEVRPGITCIWQVDGRSRVSFDEWMRMDLAYVRSRSFLMDLKLLLKTVPAVLRCTGAKMTAPNPTTQDTAMRVARPDHEGLPQSRRPEGVHRDAGAIANSEAKSKVA